LPTIDLRAAWTSAAIAAGAIALAAFGAFVGQRKQR
jgi:hypothetical protein